MRETHAGNRYVPGTYWRECDECGRDFYRYQLMKRWDGAIVCKDCNDERNPQDTPRYQHRQRLFVKD